MDRQERVNHFLNAIQAGLRSLRVDMWTALPAQVVSYDPATQSCVVQPTIQAQTKNKDGVWSNATLPQLLDVPVLWPGGGGFSLTFPLAANDEGLVVFSSRCINAWWTQGGVQVQEEFRTHNLSDGLFIPRLCSKPKVPNPNPSATLVQLISDDGTMGIQFDKAGKQLTLKLGLDTVVIDGNLHQVNITALNGLWVNGHRVMA